MKAYFYIDEQWHDYEDSLSPEIKNQVYKSSTPAEFFKSAVSYTTRVLIVSPHDFRFHIEVTTPINVINTVNSFMEAVEKDKIIIPN